MIATLFAIVIAWPAAAPRTYLVVPESDGKELEGAKKLSHAFCSKSGTHRIEFDGRQNERIEQTAAGTGLDCHRGAGTLRGARFKLLDGHLVELDRCVLADETFATVQKVVKPTDTAFETPTRTVHFSLVDKEGKKRFFVRQTERASEADVLLDADNLQEVAAQRCEAH